MRRANLLTRIRRRMFGKNKVHPMPAATNDVSTTAADDQSSTAAEVTAAAAAAAVVDNEVFQYVMVGWYLYAIRHPPVEMTTIFRAFIRWVATNDQIADDDDDVFQTYVDWINAAAADATADDDDTFQTFVRWVTEPKVLRGWVGAEMQHVREYGTNYDGKRVPVFSNEPRREHWKMVWKSVLMYRLFSGSYVWIRVPVRC